MSIRITKKGVLDSIQDRGRYGYAKWGINPGGVMDFYSAEIANSLVANPPDTPIVECHFPAAEVHFESRALIAVTGANFSPNIDGKPVDTFKSILVNQGSTLKFSRKSWGERCYIAVHGGFELAQWLGSSSTNVKIDVGGTGTGALKAGDVLKFNAAQSDLSMAESFIQFPWQMPTTYYNDPLSVSFMPGHEYNWLTEHSRNELFSLRFAIDSSSDRMAYHLIGPSLNFERHEELVSSGVNFGTVQGLPAGKLLILMADHQTTGGYPRIGSVITAHHPKLAQLSPRAEIQFKAVTIDEAEKVLFSLREDLRKIRQGCILKLQQAGVIS